MASWKKYFKVYNGDTSGNTSPLGGSYDKNASPVFRNYQSNLPDVYIGHPNRIDRYNQYEQMDMDSEINAALDILADFCTQNDPNSERVFSVFYNDTPTENEVKIITEQLNQWINLNELDQRMFKLFRNTIKYGDQVFIRDPETFKLHWTEIAKVVKIIVNESEGKLPEQFVIKDLSPNFETLTSTKIAASDLYVNRPQMGGSAGSYSQPQVPYGGGSRFTKELNECAIDAKHIVHLSMSEGLDPMWPFGTSILENIFKVFKQKELIEDAVIIYRVQRAPERRIFKIDVGSMVPHMAMAYVERIKNEIHQRRIPTMNGGAGNMTDATYNPLSTLEDFFFPTTAEGRGSSVEVLPGGCLSMDTKVVLLDGRTLSLTELMEEYKSGKQNWTFSTNPETGEIVPGMISWAGITQKSAKVMRLTLDNGETIVCTPDHKFPILGKGLLRADELSVGEHFIPFNSRNTLISNNKKLDYTEIYQNNSKKWQYVHRMVAKNISLNNFVFDENNSMLDMDVIHHSDMNRYNNSPDNLVWMSWKDHQMLHTHYGFSRESSLKGCQAAIERLNKMRENKDEWEKHTSILSENAKKYWQSLSEEEYSSHVNSISKALKEYHALLDSAGVEKRNLIASNNFRKGTKKFLNMISTDEEFYIDWMEKKKTGWENFKNSDAYHARSQKISISSKNRFLSEEYRYRVFKNQSVNYDRFIMDSIKDYVSKGDKEITKDDVLSYVNNSNLLTHFLHINRDTKCANWDKTCMTKTQLSAMLTKFGYQNWRQFKREVSLYNHTLVSIEYLPDQIEVGTLTIDVDEKYHDYHNFALSVGVFTQNSNLGEITDLKFFSNKLFRGLRIPSSYLPQDSEDGSQSFNDGRVGTALIQEWTFNQYCKRIQKQIIPNLDREFKMFLRWRGVNIDNSLFKLVFNEPQNFAKYRQVEIDTARIGTFSQVESYPYLSKRFMLQRFLGLSEEEIAENERMWKEENPSKTVGTQGEDTGLRGVGITPGDVQSDMDMFAGDELENLAGVDQESDLGITSSPVGGQETPPAGTQGV